jgi:prolyl oligopeptidase
MPPPGFYAHAAAVTAGAFRMNRSDRSIGGDGAAKPGTSRRAVLAAGAAGSLLALTRGALAQGSPPQAPPPGPRSTVPPAPRDATTDILHGTPVPDPFRPLENLARADVGAWVDAQDVRARAYLASLPTRERVRRFFDAALNYPRTSIPARHGTRYFSYFNNGLDDQRSYDVQEGLAGKRRRLIDARTLSRDGATSISNAFPDRTGSRVAYLLSEAGSDRQTLRIREVDTGMDLPDQLTWCKHTSVAWHPDGRFIFYSRYPMEGEPASWDRRSQVLCLHRLVTPQTADRVLFRLPALRDVYLRVDTSFEEGLLRLTVRVGTSERPGYYVAPLDDPARFSELVPVDAAGFTAIGNLGLAHYALTNLDAPRWRLVRIDQSNPQPERWRTVVPESELPLDHAALFNDCLVVKHTENLGARISTCGLDGQSMAHVDVGGLSRVLFGRNRREDDHLLLEVEDYQRHSRIERLDLAGGKLSLQRASAARHDLSDAVVRQVFVTSRDGTQVPMTLIHRRGVALDGDNRTLLYAYGGFGVSLWPGYSERAAAWVRLGGVYAIASVRGGGEYGQPWHDGGRLAQKQHTFDDFIAASEWLIANGYTRPQRLGITGASNGGLLVLACMLQRPGLYGAVVSAVPVADMLRFQKFNFGSNWMVEYGNPDRAADFRTLIGYSPLHNVRHGVTYPPLLMLTADNDDRVSPVHAYKFVATMQAQAPAGETYLRVERRAGHGFGNSLSKTLDRDSDTLAFLCDKLGGPLLDLPRIE